MRRCSVGGLDRRVWLLRESNRSTRIGGESSGGPWDPACPHRKRWGTAPVGEYCARAVAHDVTGWKPVPQG
jgi:hypothetical protein